jgi:adenine-specific DNA-methyltransferase
MKYIGNKTRLLDFINDSIVKSKLPKNGTFIDIFGGTGSVGKYFKSKNYKVIANDFMTYSYIAQYVLIKINKMPSFERVSRNGISGVLKELNTIKPKNGYIFNNFAPNGKEKRQYFSNENARKIDAIRDKIERWRNDKLLSNDEYYILVYSLIDAADFVANISGTYGAYLKIWRSMALKKLELKIPDIINNNLKNEVFQEDANLLIKKISGDILYLDPPYNERQYASNFHILETLAVWDKQKLVGKTGQRDYSKKKSLYSQKTNSIKTFEDLVVNANTKYIILSYNNEGIIPKDEILRILNNKGKVSEYTTNYRRFRTERDHEKRHYKKCEDKVLEHLYITKVS